MARRTRAFCLRARRKGKELSPTCQRLIASDILNELTATAIVKNLDEEQSDEGRRDLLKYTDTLHDRIERVAERYLTGPYLWACLRHFILTLFDAPLTSGITPRRGSSPCGSDEGDSNKSVQQAGAADGPGC